MSLKFRSIILTTFLCAGLCAFSQQRAQKAKWEPEDAEEHFKMHNFMMALPMYKELVKREPEHIDYNYKLAFCYLNTYVDKTAAVPYLEKVVKEPKCKSENWFLMGKAYHLANKFDK